MEDFILSDLIVYILFILAGITATHTVLERLLHYSLFTAFIKFIPIAIRDISNSPKLSLWVESHTTNRDLYEMCGAVLIYFIILSSALFLFFGCWVYLILQILSIVHIPTSLLVTWFIVIFLLMFISAGNQTAVFLMVRDRRLKKIDTIKNRMRQNPSLTLKLTLKFFLTNLSPLNTLKVLLVALLIIVFYWPAWIIQPILKKRINLNDANTRSTYFTTCAFVYGIFGTSINFFL